MTLDADDCRRRIDALLPRAEILPGYAASHAAGALNALSRAIEKKETVFGVEPWHVVHENAPLPQPGEMLLRLTNENGGMLMPYPMIMAFYNNGMTAEIDTLLVLCALAQFAQGDEAQVSINISARSLRDGNFIKTVLPAIEAMKINNGRKIIFEIHESAPSEIMSRRVLDFCRNLGIGFALDDVGLSMNDLFRLSEFEGMADFIKIDRKTVCAAPDEEGGLEQVMALINATLPGKSIVAEGAQDSAHAAELLDRYPRIQYVQGLHLPGRDEFAREWRTAQARPLV